MRTALALGVLVCLLSRPALADLADDTTPARMLGMGGVQRGIGLTNETIYSNPAGIGVRRRYDAEFQYQRDGVNDLNAFNLSVLDAMTGPVGGAVAYTFRQGGRYDASLHQVNMGFGLPLGENLAVGIMGKHIFGHDTPPGGTRQEPSLWSGDIGLIAKVANSFQVGVSSRNLIRDQKSQLIRRDLGAGVAYIDETITIGGDIIWDLDDELRGTAYRVGGEYLAGQTFPLRFGFARRPFRTLQAEGTIDNGMESTLSGGTGLVFGQGALNFGYEHSLQRKGAFQFAIAATLSF